MGDFQGSGCTELDLKISEWLKWDKVRVNQNLSKLIDFIFTKLFSVSFPNLFTFSTIHTT